MAGRILADQLRLDHVDPSRHAAREQRPRARHRSMSLVLRVGRVRELLAERVVRVRERAHQRRVRGDVERLQAIGVPRGIEHQLERLVVGRGRSVRARGAPHPRSPRASGGRSRPAARCGPRGTCRRLRPRHRRRRPAGARRLSTASSSGGLPTCSKNEGSIRETSATIRSTTSRGLAGRVPYSNHAAQPVQHQAGDGVDHRRVAGDRDHVARGLDRLLLGLARHAAPERHGLARGQPPEIGEPLVRAPGAAAR